MEEKEATLHLKTHFDRLKKGEICAVLEVFANIVFYCYRRKDFDSGNSGVGFAKLHLVCLPTAVKSKVIS